MYQLCKRFSRDESGAVTVDWVVLTAAVIGMSAISFFAIEDSSNGLMTATSGAIDNQNDFGTGEED